MLTCPNFDRPLGAEQKSGGLSLLAMLEREYEDRRSGYAGLEVTLQAVAVGPGPTVRLLHCMQAFNVFLFLAMMADSGIG